MDAFGMKSSKQKAMGDMAVVTPYEQENNMSHGELSIRRRKLDGKSRLVYTFTKYFPGHMPEEYTDKDKFKAALTTYIDKVSTKL